MPSIVLSRECEVTAIPSGERAVLPAGAEVIITQELGGAITVRSDAGLFRVDPADADALGRTAAGPAGEATKSAAEGPVTEEQVWDALRECYDPEIPVNIVDLGLVYDLKLEGQPNGQSKVAVKMTLTAPGCGMGPVIAADAQRRIAALVGVEEAEVEVVWDPPWHHSMISASGRRALGIE